MERQLDRATGAPRCAASRQVLLDDVRRVGRRHGLGVEPRGHAARAGARDRSPITRRGPGQPRPHRRLDQALQVQGDVVALARRNADRPATVCRRDRAPRTRARSAPRLRGCDGPLSARPARSRAGAGPSTSDSIGAYASSTSQSTRAAGPRRRSAASTGSACTMSPSALMRTMRMRVAKTYTAYPPRRVSRSRRRVVLRIADDGDAAAVGAHGVALGHGVDGVVGALAVHVRLQQLEQRRDGGLGEDRPRSRRRAAPPPARRDRPAGSTGRGWAPSGPGWTGRR